MIKRRWVMSLIVGMMLMSVGCSTAPQQSAKGTPRLPVTQPPSPTPFPLSTCATFMAQAQVPPKLVAMPAFDGGGAASGVMSNETLITTQTAGHLGCLWRTQLPGVVDGTFVAQPGVQTANGTRDLIFATTNSGTTFALDAHSGKLVWQTAYPPGACLINGQLGVPCITTSSPALDPAGQYVYGYGLDGAVHKLHTATGLEVTGGGWPEFVTLKVVDEKESSALNIANGYLYVANGGYRGDGGDYQGHVTAINLATGRSTIFNTLCSDVSIHFKEAPPAEDCAQMQSAVWARPGVTVDPVTGNVFFTTGNGNFDPSKHDWGDTVLMVPRDLMVTGGQPRDSYTPAVYDDLDATDRDLGSAAPALLPQQAGSRTPWLLVQAGKDNVLRVINRQNLSGRGGPGNIGGEVATVPLPQGGPVLTQPVVWNDPTGQTWLFVTNASGLAALRVVTDQAGHTSLVPVYQLAEGGTSPVVAGGVLWLENSGAVDAMNATTGAFLWRATNGEVHWQSPLVANGTVVVCDSTGLAQAFALPTP